jgi:hypothetical protein
VAMQTRMDFTELAAHRALKRTNIRIAVYRWLKKRAAFLVHCGHAIQGCKNFLADFPSCLAGLKAASAQPEVSQVLL